MGKEVKGGDPKRDSCAVSTQKPEPDFWKWPDVRSNVLPCQERRGQKGLWRAQRAGTQRACWCRCCNQTGPFPACPDPSSSPTERLHRQSTGVSNSAALGEIRAATYSWPGQGSYCCTLGPPRPGLSVTDGITETVPLTPPHTLAVRLRRAYFRKADASAEKERRPDVVAYRKAHVSQLLDETVQDPHLVWLVANLMLRTHRPNHAVFSNASAFHK